MLSDLKYAFRQFVKMPGFTATAVLILALGIGANAAIFTFVDALLLRSLPVRRPGELVLMSQSGIQDTIDGQTTSQFFSYPNYQQFRDRNHSLDGVVAITLSGDASLIASGLGQSDVITARISNVSGNFFSVLGVPAFLGRTLTSDDDRTEKPQSVAVLSYAFWQRRFGGDPSVVGKIIQLNKIPLTIVGVTAPRFSGVVNGDALDLWAPLELTPALYPGTRSQFAGPRAAKSFSLFIFGRLHAGVTRKAADAELDVIYQGDLASSGLAADPVAKRYFGSIEVQPGGSGYLRAGFGDGRAKIGSLLDILMGVVGVALVVACANVAGLLLARAAVRQRELALRAALGAGQGRLIRQLFTESLLLAGTGGVLGLLFARWGMQALAGYFPNGATYDLRLDGSILAFVTAVSIVSGILVGVIPALQFSRLNLIEALKDQGSTMAGGSSTGLNRLLVAAQIALSVCLLVGSGLFVRTLQNLKNVDLGFNRRNLIIASVQFDGSYDATRRATLSRDLLAGLAALPEVRGVTFSTGGGGLLSGGNSGGTVVSVEGYVPKEGEPMDVFSTNIGPRFFETFGMALIRGRGFEFADAFAPSRRGVQTAGNDVVISEAMARKFFSDRDPIGGQIRVPNDQIAKLTGTKQITYQIIGVVKDTKYADLREGARSEMFLPYFTSNGGSDRAITFELRTAETPRALAAGIRTTIRAIDPISKGPTLKTMDDVLDRALSQETMVARTASGFSLFTLLLASLGLYGVLAYNVTRRTREIGVRMAVGAVASDIVLLIVRQGLTLAVLGCVAGIVASGALGHLVASQLYGVPAVDPLTLLVAVAVLLVAALTACWLPARRATQVDPIVALRAE
jgi:predicted permease